MNDESRGTQDDERLFSSIDETTIATVITGARLPDNPVVAVNDAFCALTGYTREEIVGHNCRFLGGPVTESEGRAALRAAVAEKRPVLVELTNYRRDGTRFRNAVMVAPIFGPDGTCDYFIGSQMEVGGAGLGGGEDRRARAEELVAGLSPRQLQVLDFMIAGYRNKQIAGFLSIDEKTVKMHRAAMLVKLGVRSSAEGVRIGVEAGRPGGGR